MLLLKCGLSLKDGNAPLAVILFSIVALEKFSQTTENKITIQKRLKLSRDNQSVDDINAFHKGDQEDEEETEKSKINPLLDMENWLCSEGDHVSDEKSYMRRQVGFCSQWCLDNLCKFIFTEA